MAEEEAIGRGVADENSRDGRVHDEAAPEKDVVILC